MCLSSIEGSRHARWHEQDVRRSGTAGRHPGRLIRRRSQRAAPISGSAGDDRDIPAQDAGCGAAGAACSGVSAAAPDGAPSAGVAVGHHDGHAADAVHHARRHGRALCQEGHARHQGEGQGRPGGHTGSQGRHRRYLSPPEPARPAGPRSRMRIPHRLAQAGQGLRHAATKTRQQQGVRLGDLPRTSRRRRRRVDIQHRPRRLPRKNRHLHQRLLPCLRIPPRLHRTRRK